MTPDKERANGKEFRPDEQGRPQLRNDVAAPVPGSSDSAPSVISGDPRSSAATITPGTTRRASREGGGAQGEAEGTAAAVDGTKEQGGLTLKVVIEDAKSFSAQASTNTRYLAAGGLAVVWALAEGEVSGLRRPSMSLTVLGFVLALGADFLHYATATKKLVAVIERSAAAGGTYESVVQLTRADLPATAWFTWKTRFLVAAYIVLAWAFVMTVYPEAGDAVRRLVAAATR